MVSCSPRFGGVIGFMVSNPPQIPEFYTLTKIHKPSPVGRPIVSGCDGPTEKLSSFVDKLLQPIAQQQKSYLKDTTDFVNFIENTKVPVDVILVSMDVTSLYTNIPQEEGIDTVCRAYEIFYRNEPPIPTQLLKRALRLILQENSFQFNGKNYLQTHGTAMGTKMAVAFSNIFMNKVEMEILSQSLFKPLVWKRYIDDIFLRWPIYAMHKYFFPVHNATYIYSVHKSISQCTNIFFSAQMYLSVPGYMVFPRIAVARLGHFSLVICLANQSAFENILIPHRKACFVLVVVLKGKFPFHFVLVVAGALKVVMTHFAFHVWRTSVGRLLLSTSENVLPVLN